MQPFLRCIWSIRFPILDLCDEYGTKANQIYTWQKVLFDHTERRPSSSPATVRRHAVSS